MDQACAISRRQDNRLDAPGIEAVHFRDAMALLASGVAIAACWDGEAPKGLLISSVTALSVEPPRMLFCVRKASSSHNALLRAERCSLSILSEAHREDADRFSRTERTAERFGEDHWTLERWHPPRHKTPLIGLAGVISHRIDAGTHTVFILDVYEVRTGPARPLIYFDRDYRGLKSEPEDGASFAQQDAVAHKHAEGWRLGSVEHSAAINQ